MSAASNSQSSTTMRSFRFRTRATMVCLALLMVCELWIITLASSGNNNLSFFPRRIVQTSAADVLSRSIPALSTRRKRNNKPCGSSLSSSQEQTTIEVSITNKKKRPRTSRSTSLLDSIRDDLQRNSGFFYGIKQDLMVRPASDPEQQQQQQQSRPTSPEFTTSTTKVRPPSKSHSLPEMMSETLQEMREMREEMAALRREMLRMRKRRSSLSDEDYEDDEEEEEGEHEQKFFHRQHIEEENESGISSLAHRHTRQREFDKIGKDVEQWAEKMLFQEDGEQHGWTEVRCNKMFRNKFNKDKNIKCYLKWMKDSRGGPNDDDAKTHPCIKCYATLDAPMENVCAYLADERRVPEYNDLVVSHKDLEEISPHSKICWGQCPKILFIKPRDFVTFCHHRWLRDGTQVVINQAVEHPDAPGIHEEKEGKACRAYALRGANFISRDPEDPSKTRFCLLAHADPGGIPPWACKTAVNALAPIEPFKLFYKINKNVKKYPPHTERTEMVSSVTGRSPRAAGLSQLGYACFWPKGGGLKEGILHHSHPQQVDPSEAEGGALDETHGLNHHHGNEHDAANSDRDMI